MINELIKNYISPDLKKEGFNKQRLTWNRKQGEIVHVINLQKGRKHSDGSVDFTLNLGLFVSEIWTICWGKSIPKTVKEEDCFPRLRIGLLLADFNPMCIDKWWILSSIPEIEVVGLEIKEIINQKCFPFFQQFQTKEIVERFVDSSIQIRFPLEKLCYSILKKINGDDNTSRNIIGQLENDEYWGTKAKEIKDRLS